MNNIEKVSIGGYAFSLETEAYKAVKQYLEELERFYKGKKSGKEVMDGIEERMAELLLEKVGEGCVATLSMVESTIATLGKPSAIEAESIEDETVEAISEPKIKHRLYRDKQNKYIAGVLAGLASFFNIDVAVLRAVALILCIGGFALDEWKDIDVFWIIPAIYCIAWICMPVAKTVQQRLEMRGQSGSVDEIQKDVENGDFSRSQTHSDFWLIVGRICKLLIGLLLFGLGMSFLITGIFLFFGASILWATEWAMNWTNIVTDFPIIETLISPLLIKIGLVLIWFIPCLGMIYGGISMIFNLKAPSWHPGLIMFLLWIVLMIALLVWFFVAAIPTLQI